MPEMSRLNEKVNEIRSGRTDICEVVSRYYCANEDLSAWQNKVVEYFLLLTLRSLLTGIRSTTMFVYILSVPNPRRFQWPDTGWPLIVDVIPNVNKYVQVKKSLNSPELSLRVPLGWGYQISRQSAHEGGKVVSPTHRPPLHLRNIPDTHFC